ncbi:hypothetical protein AB0C77_00290 [Streptomyces sp. NPDC048629]|uniref:hypothetical protein n=1 Tax=Streptomyces sp. NPDC048629 TaxID=3154824 RepID=UPI00344646D5
MRHDSVDGQTLQVIDLLREQLDSLQDEKEDLLIRKAEIDRGAEMVDHHLAQVTLGFEAMSELLPEETARQDSDGSLYWDNATFPETENEAPQPDRDFARNADDTPLAQEAADECGEAEELADDAPSEPEAGCDVPSQDSGPSQGSVPAEPGTAEHGSSSELSTDESFETERDAVLTVLGSHRRHRGRERPGQ